MSKVILYDLATKAPRVCWSFNTWKTRLVLNFKGIDYETKWIEYSEVAATLKSNVPPNKTGRPYTVPVIILTDTNEWIMDSEPIARKLEELYPSPPLHLDSEYRPRIETIYSNIITPLRGVWTPKAPKIFNEPGKEYFNRTRKEVLGMSLEEFEERTDAEKAWKEATVGIDQLAELLKENEGPYIMGKEPSYADFHIINLLESFRVVDEEELFGKIVAIQPTIADYHAACEKWLKRNDH